MTQNWALLALISLVLVLANAFFVAAEYGLVGSRRSRIEAFAKRKKRNATWLLRVLDDVSPYIAATQIGITMVGVAVGSVTEPFVTGEFMRLFQTQVPHAVSFVISYLVITFVLVVVGELFPKYLSIKMPERVAVVTTRPLVVITTVLRPIVWLAQASASQLLKPFGIDPNVQRSEAMPKDELLLLIRAGSSEGMLEKMQAEFLARTLRLNVLDAKDVMVHRLDMRSIEVNTPKEELIRQLGSIPHSRVPVYEEDLDSLVGILYVHDVIKSWSAPSFDLRSMVRSAVVVPENLSADKIITTMRESKTQIVIVADEYGGTSGLITLEDVVEEIFGELEDQLESERPPIEILPNGRVTARADVRYDELVLRLGIETTEDQPTDTLATILANSLEHVPRMGDRVDTPLGTLYVENMARRRITRVSLLPNPELKRIPLDL